MFADQIEKFALRFGMASDARIFMDVLKANMKGSIETGIPRSDLTENSSQSEFVASNRLQYSGEELGLVDHVAIDVPQIAPVLNDHNYIPNVCSLESYQHYNLDRTNGDFPPSFTELMTNCSAEAEKATNVPEEFDISSQLMITQVPEEFDIKSHLMVTKVPEEFDIKSQIMRCMSDSSFHDMLTKVEQVIIEMGGDLSL
ncbi:hypothetical protein Syun_024172 [Stephania yunnanensis]|uniref:Uncharacterized protein n=1 Tax=Stephania yunnanensis TaxID=152371 RepID=A0AAP0FBD1_9MAGN